MEALQITRLGKVPGPDGFHIEFYKEFQPLVLEPLLQMLNFLWTKLST